MDYMEKAFEGDAELQRAVSMWVFLDAIQGSSDSPQRNWEESFLDAIKEWGYWKVLEELPTDTVAIQLRDLINSKLRDHHILVSAALQLRNENGDGMDRIVLDFDPTDVVAENWYNLLLDAHNGQFLFKLCKQCGKPFAYTSHRAIYCSEKCRTKASRERNAPA